MKRILLITAASLATLASASVMAADVGVSITVGQPGFYGHIDIGDFPQPRVVYRQPVIIQPVPVAREPIYVRVPPGHRKKWKKYCGQYDACGRPVYFVENRWYNDVYVPRYREKHRDDYRHDDRHRDDDRRGRGDDRDDDRGQGRGHGNNGNGKGHGHNH